MWVCFFFFLNKNPIIFSFSKKAELNLCKNYLKIMTFALQSHRQTVHQKQNTFAYSDKVRLEVCITSSFHQPPEPTASTKQFCERFFFWHSLT